MQFGRPGWIFAKDEDALTTMRKMAYQVRDCLAKSREVIQTANDIVAPLPPRDKRSQIDAIWDFLLHRFRYVSDPVGVELLRDPASSLHSINTKGYTQGDCDEAAMDAASLGMANGIAARFRSLAFGSPTAPYTHVICDLAADGQWFPIDITKPQGFVAPSPSRTLILPV